MPWAKHSWHLASFGGDVLCYTVAWTEPPHAEDICAVTPISCLARPSPQPPLPRRPVRPQAASAVGISLRTVYQGCPTCQLRPNATEKGRHRVPTLASGAPPRERKDAVWAGFEVTGGLWVLRARSARFSSVKHARTRTHAHAHTRTYTHTHTQTHTYRCAGGSYPSHPTSSVHRDIDLLCAPNGIAESGIFRMAPRDACQRL